MQALSRNLENLDWLTIIFMASLILLSIAKYAYPARFMSFISLVVSDNYLAKTRKEVRIGEAFDLLLFLVQVFNISAFLYLTLDYLGVSLRGGDQLLYIRILLAYFLFVGVKFFIERIFGVLIDGENLLNTYHYHKLVYRNYLGIILIPINALIVYTFDLGEVGIWIVVGMIVFINLVGIVKSMRKYESLIYKNAFYFILYLCALEIAPYLMVFKLIEKQVVH